MAGETANDKAWANAFESLKVVETVDKTGFIDVTADQLRKFREPRHMGKIDHRENLPKVFKDEGLSILTLSNSSYRLGRFEIFQNLPTWEVPGEEIKTLTFPSDLETLDFQNLTGEPGVINTAFATDMLENFCGEELVLTVSGRMRTGEFGFTVDKSNGEKQSVQVTKAQMEIDAAFEGKEKFL